MKQIMWSAFYGVVENFKKKLPKLSIPTETPSQRYVNKLKTRRTKSTNGQTESRMKMGRLEDPNFEYVSSAESNKPGYLEKRMAIYKEMIESEQNRAIRSQSKDIRIQQGNSGSVYGQQNYSEQSPKLVAIGKKG